MKRAGMFTLAAALAVGLTHAAFAGPGCSKSASGGCTKAAGATASAESANPVDSAYAQVMSALPKMTYKVGALETPCCKTAGDASAKSGDPIQYVVAGETYACKQTAMNRLAEQMQQELPRLARVVHVVDGQAVDCAQSAAKLASDKQTQVQYLVAGVGFDCPQKAQTVADRLAAKIEKSHGCAKAFAGDCDKNADTASAKIGGCSKSAETASAKTGGCSKEAAEAKTASVAEGKGGCCSKSKGAETASAETASAKTGGCSKEAAEAKTASATEGKGGCCAKGAAAAQTADAAKVTEAAADATAEAAEETPQLANAKQLVREIVEFVAAARNS